MKEKTSHKDYQKYSERVALNILTNQLMIQRNSIIESESPDFIFRYEGKKIGAEVVEYHRNPLETEARKLYQKAIDNYKCKKGKLTSITALDECITNFNKKKDEQQLLDDINKLLADPSYEAQHVQSADEWYFDDDSELPISFCSIGICQHVKADVLERLIRNKEKKLKTYQNLDKNIEEYWLIVFVNKYEYDYLENMERPLIITSYDRIYLTHLEDGVLRIK